MDDKSLAATTDPEQLRAFLAHTPLFRAAPADALVWLTEQLRAHDVASGTAMIRQGDAAHDLYLIESGRLEVRTTNGSRDITLGLLGPGDFFGEMALLRKAQRSATVTALTDARLWSLSRADLAEAIRQHPAIGDHLRSVTRQRALANALHALQ
jgi:voltage-gated potassium channel